MMLADYCQEDHAGVVSGTGHNLLASGLSDIGIERHVTLEPQSFLGLTAILSSPDLLVTLLRHTGETLAPVPTYELSPAPFPIPSLTVKQHWHARFHHDASSRWLREVCADLFQRDPKS